MKLDLAKVHPFDPALLESPWDWYRQLRAEAPVFRDPFTGIFCGLAELHVAFESRA